MFKTLLILAVITLTAAHQTPKKFQNRSVCGKRASESCILFNDVTEGPYYIHSQNRQNITEGYPGIPLRLYFNVRNISTCEAMSAAVEIWHCSALGVYSAFQTNGNNGGVGTTFLRGLQVTNSSGGVTFDTIFPGWYTGRTTHIHLKVHVGGSVNGTGYYTGGHVAHVGQMFFDQSLLTQVASLTPYTSNKQSVTPESSDNIYKQAGTDALMPYYQVDSSDVTKGLVAYMTLGVDTSNSVSSTADGGSRNAAFYRSSMSPPVHGSIWMLAGSLLTLALVAIAYVVRQKIISRRTAHQRLYDLELEVDDLPGTPTPLVGRVAGLAKL